MEFHILGPLEILDDDGANVVLRGSRERAVLALLLLSANRVVPAERLADDLWGERPPEGAAHALNVHLSRLRTALREAGGGEVVVTRPPGYLVHVDPATVDAFRFEALVTQARERIVQGEAGPAAVMLREALGLWRGPALADVADLPRAQAEAVRLEEARLAALEDRVEADLACGRHTEVVAELDALTRAHPFRERLWAQRMVALYRAGRQADALRVYQELRVRLGEELGLEPTGALRRLEGAILRHEPDLDWPPQRARPEPSSVRTGILAGEEISPVVPMPALLTEIGRVFVGRELELNRLEALWTQAAGHGRRLALLFGEPGVGKTRLAAEFARRVHDERATVLAGRCDEDMGVPYQPFVEALRHYVDHAPAEDLGERLGRHGGELQRLVPELAQRVPTLPDPLRSDPETERYRLFDAVAAWLAAASGQEPLLVVLDDLQWAAKPTLFLMRHVLRSPEGMSLLVLATYRDSDIGKDHPLAGFLADLRKEQGVERIGLTGLDASEVADYLIQAAGHELDETGEQLARAVWRQTEGSPFFVAEVVRSLAESGAMEQRDGRWVVTAAVEELGIPEGVRDVVGRRLSRLSEEANRVLACASVAGLEFEPAVIQTADSFNEDVVLSALEEGIVARLLVEVPGRTPRNQFAHALVRATLYDQLTAARRAALHRKVAEAVETLHATALDDHLPALAHHWAQASGADTSRAVDYATRAGDRALTQLANDEAATYYRQALDLLNLAGVPATDPRRIELLISLGQAQLRAGDPDHRQTLLDAAQLAEQAGDANVFARAALANFRGFFSVTGAVDVDRVAVLDRVLETLDQGDSPVRARLLAHLAGELAFSPHHGRRQELAAEALAMARRLGHPPTLAKVLASRAGALVQTAERYEEAVELAELANRSNDPALLFWAQFITSMLALTVGDLHAYVDGLEEAERLANELCQPTMRWAVTLHRSVSHRRAGWLDEAEALGRQALEIGQAAGLPDARQLFDSYSLYWIRYDQGRLDELVEHFERKVASSGLAPLTLVNLLGLIYCELGRLSDARRMLDRLAGEEFAMLPRCFVWLGELTVAAQISATVGDRVRAATLYRLLLPYRELVAQSGSSATGGVVHYLALLSTVLGQFDEAEGEFESAAALHERMAAPTWLARTRLEWARMLQSRGQPGDVDRARELLGQALATARDLGLGAVERQAGALLQ